MDVITIYMTAMAGILASRRVTFFVWRWCGFSTDRQLSLLFWWPWLDLVVCRIFTYPRLIHRHGFTQPWTRVELLAVGAYMAANVAVVVVYHIAGHGMGRVLGSLFAANMVPLYFGHRHDLPAWVLRLSLRTYSRLHRVVGLMCVVLAASHSWVSWNRSKDTGWTWNLLVGECGFLCWAFDRMIGLTASSRW